MKTNLFGEEERRLCSITSYYIMIWWKHGLWKEFYSSKSRSTTNV